jgi:regulator of protease activity HflC (stomatin/prohibitin superfamily)
MNGLAWLNDLMVWLARWVPRLTLIKATHEGVLFGPGGSVKRRAPGLCLYWPITHDLQLVGTRARTAELAAQLHAGEAVSVVVGWRVIDAVRCLSSLNDPAAFLDDRTQAALGHAYTAGKRSADVCAAMLEQLSREFDAYGMRIESVDVAQRSWVIPVKTLKDYAQHESGAL